VAKEARGGHSDELFEVHVGENLRVCGQTCAMDD